MVDDTSWIRDVVTTSVPALVALLVVWIGGRQQQARQRDELRAAEDRWRRQEQAERDRWTLQERRKVYAEYLGLLERLGYLTTHVLGHSHPDHPPMCEDHHDDARQDWMVAHERLVQLGHEITLVGSLRFYDLAREAEDIYREIDLDAPPQIVNEWFFQPDGSEPGPLFKRATDLRTRALVRARGELDPYTAKEIAELEREQEISP